MTADTPTGPDPTGALRLTWWGHATSTVELDGVRVLTDPVLTRSVGHLRRRRGPTPTADARRADVVLLSHLHADHLHLPSLRSVAPAATLVAPRGTRSLLRRADPGLAERCVEVDPGDRIPVAGLSLRVLPAVHDGRRLPGSRHRASPVGYVVTGSRVVWFAGDTDLHETMNDLGRVDLALVPVAGWGPSLGPGHLDAERAAEAVRRARPTTAVPIHFGTLWPRGLAALRPHLFLGPELGFREATRRLAPEVDVRVLEPGGTLVT